MAVVDVAGAFDDDIGVRLEQADQLLAGRHVPLALGDDLLEAHSRGRSVGVMMPGQGLAEIAVRLGVGDTLKRSVSQAKDRCRSSWRFMPTAELCRAPFSMMSVCAACPAILTRGRSLTLGIVLTLRGRSG